jgi:hypothetical protein
MKKLLILFAVVLYALCCSCCSGCSGRSGYFGNRQSKQENLLFDISYGNIVGVRIDSGGTAFLRVDNPVYGADSISQKQSGAHYRIERAGEDSVHIVSCYGCHSFNKRISTRKAEIYLSNFSKVYFDKRVPLPDSAMQWGHLQIAEVNGDTTKLNLYAVRGDAFRLYAVRTKPATRSSDTVVMPYAPIDRIFSPHRYFDLF